MEGKKEGKNNIYILLQWYIFLIYPSSLMLISDILEVAQGKNRYKTVYFLLNLFCKETIFPPAAEMNVTFDCTTWNFSFPLVWREQPWYFKDLFTNFIFRSSGFFLGCVSIWTRTYRTHWDCLKLFEVAILGLLVILLPWLMRRLLFLAKKKRGRINFGAVPSSCSKAISCQGCTQKPGMYTGEQRAREKIKSAE